MTRWISAVLLVGCGGTAETLPVAPPVPPVSASPHDGVDFRSVDACSTCHALAVEEWSESMHARSHADRDPLYSAMRTLRMKVQGEAVGAKCAKCHNPLDPSVPDSPAGRSGVACGACHEADPSSHAALADGRSVCLTCHGTATNPAGVATCTTGLENESRGEASCVGCHMPLREGRRAHVFAGPHRAWLQDDRSMLKSAVSVSVVEKPDATEVSVTNLTGHAFPSGFPGRVASIRLTAGDWNETPPELLFRKVYTDAEGKPTLPPFGVKLAVDSRLAPGETRQAVITRTPGTEPLRADLVFALLPPPAAEKLGVQDLPEATPVSIPVWPVVR